MTPSMDDADAEVAGIYKTFKSDSPLTVRMDNIEATPPPKKKPPPITGNAEQFKPYLLMLSTTKILGKPKIERVGTPDCTSIDTNIPDDELLENRVRQRAIDYDLGSIDLALNEVDEDEQERNSSTLLSRAQFDYRLSD
jgi:hypothetical protein